MKKVAVLNIKQFDENIIEGFYANTLQNHLITAHKDIAHPHSHNFYVAVLFTQGSGKHEIDFSSYTVKPGALFFLNPGQTHHWELSADTKGYTFFHTQDFYDMHYRQHTIHDYPFYYSMQNSPCLYLDNNNTETIASYFSRILEENKEDKPLKKQKLLALINLVYIESTRLYLQSNAAAQENRNTYYLKFRQFEDLLEKHFITEKAPSAYASLLHISPKHLNRITQAVAGKTTGDIITERVVLEARKLLVLPHDSLAAIAYYLGYNDYAYFSRLFKKKTGETPAAFINRYRDAP